MPCRRAANHNAVMGAGQYCTHGLACGGCCMRACDWHVCRWQSMGCCFDVQWALGFCFVFDIVSASCDVSRGGCCVDSHFSVAASNAIWEAERLGQTGHFYRGSTEVGAYSVPEVLLAVTCSREERHALQQAQHYNSFELPRPCAA